MKMKKINCLFLLVLTYCYSLTAQNTTLVIDNQTPGWLSSHISPNDIATLKSLTVSGSINDVDLKTIGNLVKNYNLQDRLDLSEISVVGDCLSGDMFGVSECNLKYFALPKTISTMENVLSWVSVDTLVACSNTRPKFDIVDYSDSYANMRIKHLILREGTTYFCYNKRVNSTNDKNTTLVSLQLPETLQTLSLDKFYSLNNVEIPSNIEKLRSSNISFNSDTLFVPSSVKIFYDSWARADGYYGEGGRIKCIYIQDNLEEFWLGNINDKAIVNFHVKSKTPPILKNASSISLQKCIVYVPVGSKSIYENTNTWENATIIEEVYAQNISINVPSTIYVGESYNFKVEFSPVNTTFKEVSWESNNPSVLGITKTGNAVPHKSGKVIITAINSDKSCTTSKEICIYEHTTNLSISNTVLELKIGDKEQLTAQTLPLGTSDGQITWSSSDDDIATVDENGNVKGIAKGTCTITATSVDGGYTKECVVTVVQPVQSIQLEKHETNLKVGESEELRVQITPNDANNKNIQWTSEDESIAIVSNEGVVTGVKSGKVRIYATSEENKEIFDYCIVTIIQPVTGITLDRQSVELTAIGETIQLQATVFPEDTENKNIKWSSSNETICKVSENGLVTAVKAGNATITVSTEDGNFVAQCSVSIRLKVTNVQLEKHELTLKVGEFENLRVQITPTDANNKNIKWTSEDETIATVNEEGVVTGVKAGKVRIYATSEENGEVSDYCTITIIQPVTGITLDRQSVELTAIGESIQLQATVLPEDAENKKIKWSSSNETICKVSENGLVTAVKAGNATITVSTEDGNFVAQCSVSIRLKVTNVQLEKHELTLKVGEFENLRVQITPTDANNKNIKWTSEDETIATVNNVGVVTGLKAGKVRIYATSEENSEISDYCTVTIIQPVTGITLDKQSVELTSVGESVQLQATVLPEDAENQNVRWSSSNEKVCIVSGNGNIVGLSDGVAIIIATTEEGGFLATCQITVNTASNIDRTRDNLTKIKVNGNSVYIANKLPNDIVIIYSTVGEIVYKGYDDRVVLSNGIYIVKVGNLYYKIVL